MANKVKPVPEGFHTLTPALVVRGAAEAIEFYKKAFGARETFRMPGPDGKSVMHAEIRIGDSVVMLGDESSAMNCRSPLTVGGTSVSLCLYVEDCDKVFNQAVATGAKAVMPPADMFWGDRYGKLIDPFGHEWAIMTHKEDVPPEDLAKRAEKAMAEFASKS
jgi:PhnB protein